MTIKAKKKSELNYLLDHDVFGDVYHTTYKEGTIKYFGVTETDPFTLDDTCTVELQKDISVSGVPIFYHCRKDHYDSTVRTLRANNALTGAARAFRVGQKVRVMMRDDAIPMYVVAHNQGKSPKDCLDLFRIRFRGWNRQWYEIHYCVSKQEEYCGLNQPCREPDGRELRLNKKQQRLFGFREVQGGTVIQYYGDWLIKVGPLMLIFQVGSLGLPGPMTGFVKILAGIWTPERENEAIAIGKEKEARLPKGVFGYLNPMDLEIPYPGMFRQTHFTKTLENRFRGYKYPQPRWIYTEFYAQDWDD